MVDKNCNYRSSKSIGGELYKYYRRWFNIKEKLVSDVSIISERVSCFIRHVLYNMPSAKKSEVMDKVADTQGIEIEQNDKWMQITLPILLQRKRHKNAEFVSGPDVSGLFSTLVK